MIVTNEDDRRRENAPDTHFDLGVDRYTPTLKEREPFSKIGIYDENDPLQTLIIWGSAGIESHLAQMYPPEISLFFAGMNVLRAREEAGSFAETLRDCGVKVLSARDMLSEVLPSPTQKLPYGTVLDALIAKARGIQEQHPEMVSKRLGDLDVISSLLDLDIGRYGEERALNLNWVLSLGHELPLGDLIYSRDTMNVLLGRRIRSTMREPIRQYEVPLYELIYSNLLRLDDPIIIPAGETFEGGDAYIHDGVIYVGVGARTTRGAAVHIFRELASDISSLGFRFAIVIDEEIESRTRKEKMDYMHLDTFSYPIGPHQMELDLRETSRRKVIFLETDKDGNVVFKNTGLNFVDYLAGISEEIYVIPPEEQQEFGCNNLSLNSRDIIVPLDTNEVTLKQLKRAGKNIIYVPLKENTNGYGAAHCMAGQLKREASV